MRACVLAGTPNSEVTMSRWLVPALVLILATGAHADIAAVARCQRKIAGEGA
jgi:hypothetical protein